jgi:hypothetical protein
MQDAKKAAEPIAEGKTRVKIVDAQAGQSSTGKVMFTLKCEILEGPDTKRKTTTNITLSPENGTALAIFFQNMTAIGLDDAFFAQEPSPDQVAAAMIAREADVMIKHETWQGVKRGKIDRWLAPMGGGLSLPTGPIAPGTVVGPAGPPLPTTNSSQPTVPVVGAGPTVGSGPAAPADVPPPLPI